MSARHGTESTSNGDTTASGEATPTAEARLRWEAQQMRHQPVSYTRGMRDITQIFTTTSEQLRSGELVKDEYFTLFEAVGALEIMDPKMDSGCIPEGDPFEPDFDVCGDLDANQVLWIMDELFQLEMSLHDGYPLSQTLFTSLHIFRLISPDNEYPYNLYYDRHPGSEGHLVHTVLRAYCIGVVKCCQLALQLIQDHTFYEEEDFVTYLFGRELLPKLDSEASRQLIDTALGWLEDADVDHELKRALRHRLILRDEMLQSFEGKDEHWLQLRVEIEGLKEHHELAVAVHDAFSEKVQRQLATSTPPRPMPQIQWQPAIDKWLQLCDDVIAAHCLTSTNVIHIPHCLQRATWAFAYRNPVPNTFARAKMQDILTTDENVAGQVSHFDLMLADIRDLVLSGDPLADPAAFQIEVPTDIRHQASRIIESFMSRMFAEYLNIYRMVCQNRCRMRRTFTQAIPLLDELETVARDADQELNAIITPRQYVDQDGIMRTLLPLSSWTRHHKLQVLAWTIQLGFETDLYLPEEICNMYILLHAISGASCSHLMGLEHATVERARKLLSPTADSGNIPYSTFIGDNVDYIELCCRWIESMHNRSLVTRCLSLALASLYALLEQHGIIDTKEKPYEDAQLRYDARMKPFLGIVNDPDPGLDYFKEMKSKMTPGSVRAGQEPSLSASTEAINNMVKDAKTHLGALKRTQPAEGKYIGTEDQWKKEIKSLETVCVAITVTVSQLLRIWDRRNGTEAKDLIKVSFPPPGERYHDWWVIPQIKEKK